MCDFRTSLKNLLFLSSFCAMVTILTSGCEDSGDTITDAGPSDTTTPGLRASDFEPAENCDCHPDHVREWSGSMHSYAMKDPVFEAVRAAGQSQYINALDQACVQCHSVIGSRTGEIPWGPLDTGSMSAVTKEGVGCDLCHTITSISRLSNGGIVMTPGHTKYGTISDPQATTAHESTFNPLYSASEFCGACHDFVTGGGLELETTFREWRGGGFTSTGKTCSDCHLETYIGKATPTSPQRTLHRHSFPGADLALIDFPEKPEQLALVTALLQSALTMEVTAPSSVVAGGQLAIEVQLTNDGTGHNVPSGVPFNRQMWLSVTALDTNGDTLFVSGQLDANDDLMDSLSAFPERDPDLFNIQATMLRADSLRTGATWDAVYLTDPSIRPGETRAASYAFDVPGAATGPITIEVKLRFRSFAPHILRGLALDSLLPVPIIEMAQNIATVTVQ